MKKKSVADLWGGPPQDYAFLHIRGQFIYHAEATIKGTSLALRELMSAIQQAIEGGVGVANVMATVIVTCPSTVSGLGEPSYLDNDARELADRERAFLVHESRLMGKQYEEAIEALKWCRKNGNPHKATA